MTQTPEDQPTMWFKQVPDASPEAEGVWRQHLLEGHHTVARSFDRPTVTVDAVTLQDLKAAADKVGWSGDPHDPDIRALRSAVQAVIDKGRR